MLLYIIRHGETDFNKLGIVQGSGVDKSLNEKGFLQSRKFYQYYREIKFDKIYTSALIRTQQSVLPFIEAGKPYEAEAALNEISWGIFEGKPQNEAERLEYWKVVNDWKSGNYDSKIKNGESAFELQARQKTFIQKLKNQTHNCVLIAMHGRAMKSFICTLLELPLSEMETFSHTNLCLYILEYTNGKFSLIEHNSVKHLE